LKKLISIHQLDSSELQLEDSDRPIVIGSGQGAHIALPGIEDTIAYIAHDRGHLFVQPAPGHSRILFHNDRILSTSAWLKSRDRIRIENYLISCELRGDRILFSVTEIPPHGQQFTPQPPSQPPPEHSAQQPPEPLPVEMSPRRVSGKKRQFIFWSLGLTCTLLVLGVLFVLTARPLVLDIEPVPDSVSISGFPPAISFGSRYLCIPGDYRILIEKDGYVPISEEIQISKRIDNQYRASLEKLPGILKLSVTPEGELSVFSGSRQIGSSPPDLLEIVAGHHRLRLERERYQPYITDIEIVGLGRTQLLEATLEPDWADITLVSDPPGADIDIAGEWVGKTPLTLELLDGEHNVTMTKELFTSAELTVSVRAGKAEEHSVRLNPLPGRLRIDSDPENVAIRIDKLFLGNTPLVAEVTPNENHEIEAALPDHVELTRTITIGPGEERRTHFKLEPLMGTVFLALSPPDANLVLDGVPISNTELQLRLPVRPHTLESSAAGFKPLRRTITPNAGYAQRVEISLEPEKAAPQTPSQVGSEPLTSPDGQSLLPVQPAPFTMGAPRSEPGIKANEREREVTLSRSFYLADKLVTNKAFRLFKKNHDSGSFKGTSLNGDNQPVVGVSWEDAAAYMNWLSQRDNLQPFYEQSGKSYKPAEPLTNGYRLPTEAEWAFAARIMGSPVQQRFPWSGGFPPRLATGNYADESARNMLPVVINGYNDGYPVSSPVGVFPPNKGGFYDMGGNVAEWCHDYYSAYVTPKAGHVDPLGPPDGRHRVVRGSSWRDASITELRLSFRGYREQARNNIGFRIARYP
jgi:formylglycine-generating enzyme required for sulfatase activity